MLYNNLSLLKNFHHTISFLMMLPSFSIILHQISLCFIKLPQFHHRLFIHFRFVFFNHFYHIHGFPAFSAYFIILKKESACLIMLHHFHYGLSCFNSFPHFDHVGALFIIVLRFCRICSTQLHDIHVP